MSQFGIGWLVQHRAWYWFAVVIDTPPDEINNLSQLLIMRTDTGTIMRIPVFSLILEYDQFLLDWSEFE